MAGIFRRYEQDSKIAIYYASILAGQKNKQEISPEDLLLGITWRQHAPDCDFRGLKESGSIIWEAVGMPHLPISARPYRASRLPLDSSSKRALQEAKREADRQGHYWIDIDHLLCGMFSVGGTAAKALQEAGWNIERVQKSGRRGRERHPPKPVSRLTRFRTFVESTYQSLGTLGPLLVFVAAFLLAAVASNFIRRH